MNISETSVRVRYSEVDRMGFAYYGHYATWFEVGRVEALRKIGVSYKELEDRGVVLPVKHYEVDFIKPVFYDDLITIRTIVPKIPDVRFEFEYEILNDQKELLCTAKTTLFFYSKADGRPCRPPGWLIDLIRKNC